jgi:hypothetical protein
VIDSEIFLLSHLAEGLKIIGFSEEVPNTFSGQMRKKVVV